MMTTRQVNATDSKRHIIVLDGWRGLSILCVLAAHLLPLGPKGWLLNSTVGPLGMALFFTLSGFLITHILLNKPNVLDFLIRRFFRILPLAWLYLIVVLSFVKVTSSEYLANFLFYGNWPPISLIDETSHFWSLCVEMQFYIGVALLVACFKKKGLLLLPFLCLFVTWFRVSNHVYIAINTYYRVDEILVGCVLGLVYNEEVFLSFKKELVNTNPYLVLVGLLVSCHPDSGFMNYFRPYLAATLVGISLYQSQETILYKFLTNKFLSYLAAISYALYVIHGGLRYTWLGEGGTLEKYLKRPMLFLVTFLLAHFSTFFYEKKCIQLGHVLSKRLIK